MEHSTPIQGMDEKDAEIFTRIKTMLVEGQGISPDSVTFESRLQEDHGIWGDDAAEFMESFQKEFKVDMSGYRHDCHFHSEGNFLIDALLSPFEFGKLRHISIETLVKAAKSGKWQESL